MYYSRLILNPRNRKVQRDLADPYELHRTVFHGFPTGKVDLARDNAEASGILYRLDIQPQNHLPILLVQSQVMPNWGFLQQELYQQYLLPFDPYQEQENPAVKERNFVLVAGQRLLFRLRANPTRRLSAGKGHKGQRVGIYEEKEQREWLDKKAQQAGFRVVRAEIQAGDKVQWEELRAISQQKRQAYQQNPTTEKLPPKTGLLEIQFDGILQVTDPAAFHTAIQAGIGSGKAFGFGLLSVAPVRG